MNTSNAGRKRGGERGRNEGRKGRPRRKEGRRTEKTKNGKDVETYRLTDWQVDLQKEIQEES